MAKPARCAFIHVLDANKVQCSLPTEEGSKSWCSMHNEVRKKVYFGYKSIHKSLDAWPEFPLSYSELQKCDSLEEVKGHCVKLRSKLALLKRCISGRAYFTERFYGNDEDFGHQTFRMNLEQQCGETEKMLALAEQRAYALLLASQNAAWVMNDRRAESDPSGEDCDIFDDDPEPQPKATAPSTSKGPEEVEDPVEVALQEKRSEIWERIWTRLARYCAPAESRFYSERVAVIWACVCRAVYTDPMLMMLAQNYDYVTDMLKDTELDLVTVERLWKAIKELYVDDVRAAIDDVLHPVRRTGEYVVVFKTRVHKDLSPTGLPFHGWGHMAALFPCYSCIRKTCKTMNDIVELTRYTILSDSRLAQSTTRYKFPYNGVRALALCGFIPNNYEVMEPRSTIDKCNTSMDRKPYWTEHKANNTICVGLSLTDPKAQAFVNGCYRHPDLEVLCRKGPNMKTLYSKKRLCGGTFRQASTRAGLNDAPWDPTQACYFSESVLEEAYPIIAPGKQITDCFQVAIVHGGEGGIEDFIAELVKLWYQAYSVDSPRHLVNAIASRYLDKEEIEVDDSKRIIPNSEAAIWESYKTLWSRVPRETTVDDEVEIETIYYDSDG